MGICLPCFHLVDQLDMLESQVQNIRDNLATKYVGTNGIKKQKSQSSHIPTLVNLQTQMYQQSYHYNKSKPSQSLSTNEHEQM
jgi:hypothetical protein